MTQANEFQQLIQQLSRSSYCARLSCAFEHPSFERKGSLQSLQKFACWPILASFYMLEQHGACTCSTKGKRGLIAPAGTCGKLKNKY
eukprot:1156990-Pelagomonas_calceolata.AAC.5